MFNNHKNKERINSPKILQKLCSQLATYVEEIRYKMMAN